MCGQQFTSVFIDGEDKCRIFKNDDIIYLDGKDEN